MVEVVKRPRLRMVDLAVINDALDCYVEVLKKQEAEAKVEKPDDWIKARENLRWKILNAKNAQLKVVMNLKGSECGRTPKTLKRLLNLTEKELGEYITFGDALWLMPEGLGMDEVTLVLSSAMRTGVVDTSMGLVESDTELRLLRKLDVLRLAAYLEVHG